MTVSPPQSLAIQAIVRAGEKLLEQGYETEDTDPASAFECFYRAAEYCENAKALYRVGLAHEAPTEFGMKEDQEKALHYYEKAGARGHAGAMFRHGSALVEAAYPGSTWLQDSFPEWIYRTEEIYPSERQKKQRERGIELVELAAKKDHADALYWLGLKGAKALTEEKDFHLFQRAVQADPDHSWALYELGKIYKIGWFPKIPDGRGGFTWGPRRGIDEEKSLRCYEQAAALGHGGALSELGEAYEYGHLGKEVNIETSIKYYEESVKADPAPWEHIIRKYGDVRTFVLHEEGIDTEDEDEIDTEDEDEIDTEDKATRSKGKGSDQTAIKIKLREMGWELPSNNEEYSDCERALMDALTAMS